LNVATQPVENASPRTPHAEPVGEDPVEQQIERDREEAHEHRRLALVERVERVHEHLERRVAGEAERIEAQRPGRLGGRGGVEFAMLIEHEMIGSASIMSPAVGRHRQQECEAHRARELGSKRVDLARDDQTREQGSVTVPSATPNNPSGSCMSRNAIESAKIAPSPSVEANIELTSTLSCVVLPAMTEGPMSRKDRADAGVAPMKVGPEAVSERAQRRQLHEQLQRAADQRADREADQRARAEMRVHPIPERDAADDRSQIEETRCHGRQAEYALGVQDPHDQRGQRHQQDERKHDARELGRERGLRRIESRREQATSCGEKTMPAMQMRAEHDGVSVVTLFASRHAASSPLRAIVLLNVVTKAVDSAPRRTNRAADSVCETRP
jgi:hypothetical protein